MLSPADLAAYIGAAAWLPQIGGWIHSKFVPPSVRIIPEQSVQIGYTSFGPIFNVRLALATETKDAIIEHMEVTLRHEAGENHIFSWTGLRETFSEITDSAGNRQLVERDQPAIALKLSTVILIEKFVRFQDRQYHARHRPWVETVVAHFNYLKAQSPTYREQILQSREFHDLLEFYRMEFWWKPGLYSVEFAIRSPTRAKLRAATFGFRLGQPDVDALRGNLDLLKADHTNVIMSDVEGYTASDVTWSWRTVSFEPLPISGNNVLKK